MNFIKSDFVRCSTYRVALLGALLTVGCENSNEPEISPAGRYGATTLITTTNGVATNHIANGSTNFLTIGAGGTTSGQMHIEVSGGEPDFDANLAGTWTLSESTVTLSYAADTFLRNMPLKYDVFTMVGDMTLSSGTRIQVTLARFVD